MTTPRKQHQKDHADGGTSRPETPELEGRVPLPEEITGKASATDADLVALFADDDSAHLADGFRGATDDAPDGKRTGED